MGYCRNGTGHNEEDAGQIILCAPGDPKDTVAANMCAIRAPSGWVLSIKKVNVVFPKMLFVCCVVCYAQDSMGAVLASGRSVCFVVVDGVNALYLRGGKICSFTGCLTQRDCHVACLTETTCSARHESVGVSGKRLLRVCFGRAETR